MSGLMGWGGGPSPVVPDSAQRSDLMGGNQYPHPPKKNVEGFILDGGRGWYTSGGHAGGLSYLHLLLCKRSINYLMLHKSK